MADKKKQKKKLLSHGIKGSRAEKLSSVVANVNKEYKTPVMQMSHDDSFVVPRVTTSVWGLDAKTNGGFPFGRVVSLYGPKSGGKTTMYLRAVGEAQKLCANCYQPGEFKPGKLEMPNLETGEVKKISTDVIVSCPCGKPRDMVVLWVDAEGVWLTEWAKKMGVRVEKTIVLRPSFGEQAYDIVTAFVAVKEVDVIVIDSLAALVPVVERDEGMQVIQQGAAARMNNKFIRKIVSGMNEAHQSGRPISLWLINQYREKIGVLFGSPDCVPGGKGQGFATSLEVEMRPGQIKVDKDTGEVMLGEFRYVVKKNKLGVPGGRGTFLQTMMDTDLFKIGDLMEHEEVIAEAETMGFVARPTKVTYEYEGVKYRGVSQLMRFFGENPEKYEELRRNMLAERLGLDR